MEFKKDKTTKKIISISDFKNRDKEYFFDGESFWTPIMWDWSRNTKVLLGRICLNSDRNTFYVNCQELIILLNVDFKFSGESDPYQKVEIETLKQYFGI